MSTRSLSPSFQGETNSNGLNSFCCCIGVVNKLCLSLVTEHDSSKFTRKKFFPKLMTLFSGSFWFGSIFLSFLLKHYFYTTFTKKPLNYFRAYVNSTHLINCYMGLYTLSTNTVVVIRDCYFITTSSSILDWNTRPWFQSSVKNFKIIILAVHPQRKFDNKLGWPISQKSTYPFGYLFAIPFALLWSLDSSGL